MPSKPMTKKQWTEYVTKTFTDCVESAYKDLIDEAVLTAVLAEREACALAVENAGMDGMGTLAAAATIRARGSYDTGRD